MDLLLLASTTAFILTGAVVGARLLLLAARTRQLSDFIVGFSLFDLSAIAYPLILLGGFAELPLGTARALQIASLLALGIGWAGVFVFTQRVFRPGEAWARALSFAGIATLAYGVIASIPLVQSAPHPSALRSPDSPAAWVQLAAICAYAWTAAEGFRCWAHARRRLELGLAEPMVVNRFWLWGWVGVCSLLSVAPSFVIIQAGGDGTTHVVARLGTALGGLACAVALQLAFLPHPAYRRWVEVRSAAA